MTGFLSQSEENEDSESLSGPELNTTVKSGDDGNWVSLRVNGHL
jgi:hypothetical protein